MLKLIFKNDCDLVILTKLEGQKDLSWPTRDKSLEAVAVSARTAAYLRQRPQQRKVDTISEVIGNDALTQPIDVTDRIDRQNWRWALTNVVVVEVVVRETCG